MNAHRNKYSNIKTFGPSTSSPNDPLTMCLASTMDRRFQHGSAPGELTGPRSAKCQHYMSERCAGKWDGFCEYFYKEHGKGGQWPNNQTWPNTIPRAWEQKAGVAQDLSMGDQLLRNTAEKRFCKYVGCKAIQEPFDPTNPDSPNITYYVGPDGSQSTCFPICSVDPSNIDNDPVMNRMLDNPNASAGTLINVCNSSKNNNVNLSGTRLGRVCDRYFENIRQ